MQAKLWSKQLLIWYHAPLSEQPLFNLQGVWEVCVNRGTIVWTKHKSEDLALALLGHCHNFYFGPPTIWEWLSSDILKFPVLPSIVHSTPQTWSWIIIWGLLKLVKHLLHSVSGSCISVGTGDIPPLLSLSELWGKIYTLQIFPFHIIYCILTNLLPDKRHSEGS